MESKVSKNWLGIFGSILFAATLMLTARVVLAHEAQNVSESQNGRLYKNLFEYRMCLSRDSNWCSEGDNFKATLFDSMYSTQLWAATRLISGHQELDGAPLPDFNHRYPDPLPGRFL